VCVCMCVYVSMCVCVFVCVSMCVYFVCLPSKVVVSNAHLSLYRTHHTHTSIRTHTHIYIYIYITHTHTHVHPHTHTSHTSTHTHTHIHINYPRTYTSHTRIQQLSDHIWQLHKFYHYLVTQTHTLTEQQFQTYFVDNMKKLFLETFLAVKGMMYDV